MCASDAFWNHLQRWYGQNCSPASTEIGKNATVFSQSSHDPLGKARNLLQCSTDANTYGISVRCVTSKEDFEDHADDSTEFSPIALQPKLPK